MWKMQQKGLKYAQGPELMTVRASSKSTIMTFSSLTHPNTSVSSETQQYHDEPITVNLT